MCFYFWCSSSSFLNKQRLYQTPCLHSYSGQDSVMDIVWGNTLQPLAWLGLSHRYMALCICGIDVSVVLKKKKKKIEYCITKKKSCIVLGMQAHWFFGLDLRRGGIDFKTTILSIFAFIWWRIRVFCSSKRGSPLLLSVFPFVLMFYVERKKAIRSMIREEGSVSGCSSLDSQTLGLLTKCLLIVDLV